MYISARESETWKVKSEVWKLQIIKSEDGTLLICNKIAPTYGLASLLLGGACCNYFIKMESVSLFIFKIEGD